MNQTATPLPDSKRRSGYGFVALALCGLLGAAIATGAMLLATRLGGQDPQRLAAEKVRYRCPMHPQIAQDHPGACPICGMTLVRVDRGGVRDAPTERGRDGASGLATIDIDPARQQLIGLTTAKVTRGTVGGSWRTVGRVAIDETRVRHINVKVPGFVERVYVDFVGKKVGKGDPLFSIYSPELLSAQQEYLLALRTRGALSGSRSLSQDGQILVDAARTKLALWDIPREEVERLEQSGELRKTLTFRSPVAGVVTKKDVVPGMNLAAGAMPYEVVDLSTVWVLADVYESELRFLKSGMHASLRLNAFPNQTFEGAVLFIDPLLDPNTRTVKVRLAFKNPRGDLRPEMFGEVVLRGAGRDALRIPADAVIDSGAEKVVFLALGAGKFQPRGVRLGSAGNALVEVVSGLSLGDEVVTRANFLVDSESRLRASLAEVSHGMPGNGEAHGELTSANVPGRAEVDATAQGVSPADEHVAHARTNVPQLVALDVTAQGFLPAESHVRSGVPVRLVVTRHTDETCATEIVLKQLGITRALPLHRPVEITFTPREPGRVEFSCAMGMRSGALVVN